MPWDDNGGGYFQPWNWGTRSRNVVATYPVKEQSQKEEASALKKVDEAEEKEEPARRHIQLAFLPCSERQLAFLPCSERWYQMLPKYQGSSRWMIETH